MAVTRIEYPLRLFPPLMIEYFARAHAPSLTRVDAALPEDFPGESPEVQPA